MTSAPSVKPNGDANTDDTRRPPNPGSYEALTMLDKDHQLTRRSPPARTRTGRRSTIGDCHRHRVSPVSRSWKAADKTEIRLDRGSTPTRSPTPVTPMLKGGRPTTSAPQEYKSGDANRRHPAVHRNVDLRGTHHAGQHHHQHGGRHRRGPAPGRRSTIRTKPPSPCLPGIKIVKAADKTEVRWGP